MIPRKVLEGLKPYAPGRSIAGGIKLSSNENPLGSSPLALEAMRQALSEAGFADSAGVDRAPNRYPDGGMHDLKERLAEYWGADTSMFLVGNGSDEVLVMLAGAFIDPGCNAITARHTFSEYTFATTIFGGQMRYAEMTAGGFDLRATAALVDSQTRIIYLCNPNNPTATAFSHDELVSFVEGIPADVAVVVDEAYGEFADGSAFPRTLELIRHFPNLIRLRTFSKIYGLAGLRVGYATANSRIIATASKLRQPFNVGTIAQRAATAALNDTRFVKRSIENNIAGRRRICERLDELQISYYPSQANYVCAHLPDGERPGAAQVIQELLKRGIVVRSLGSFGLPDHVRISVGTPEEVAALCEALGETMIPATPGAGPGG